MHLAVLVDNNTYIDQYLLGEPALSYYIEDGEEKILLDAGYSEIFLTNAKKLNVDVSAVGTIVLSHGHNDHTGGLPFLLKIRELDRVKLVAHPIFLGQNVPIRKQSAARWQEKNWTQNFN